MANYGSIEANELEDSQLSPSNENYVSKINLNRGLIAVLLLAASIAVYSTSPIVMTTYFATTQVSSSDSYWTLYREDYSPLSYFTPDASLFLKYTILDDFDAVLEPSANMHLYVDGYDAASGDSYTYSVCSNGKNCVVGSLSSSSVPVNIACEPHDTFSVSVEKVTADGVSSGFAKGKAKCLYVRREIQQLSESHLSATMDAMYALWQYSDEEGQALYGPNFRNISYFAGMHFFGASQVNADHIHEGVAFLPQHVKMTNMFEIALQAVDPSIALPYWDFTIDSAAGTELTDLPIFQETTFGSLTTPVDEDLGWLSTTNSVDDGRIPDGRWANLKSEANTFFPELKFGYGIFRAPWNMNPSPYITRFVNTHALPGCVGYKTWAERSTLMKFLEYAPGQPHASIHGDIGGVFGCDNLDFALEAGYLESFDKQKSLCSKWGFKMKSLYRTNDIKPLDSCTVNESSPTDSVCGYSCISSEDDMIEEMDDIMGKYFTFTGTSDPGWKAIRDFICTGNGYKVYYGDHLESSSAVDPSFWSIHPTQERLLQAKFMANGFSDVTWSTDASTSWICERSECYMPELADDVAYHSECCLGHYEFDGFLDYENQRPNATIGWTNRAMLDAIDPTSAEYSVSYIYADFSWTHCAGAHGDVDATLQDLYENGVAESTDDGDDY